MNPDYIDDNGNGVYILSKNGQEVGRWTNDIGLSLEAAAAKVAEILASFDPPVVAGPVVPPTIGPAQLRVALLTTYGITPEQLEATVVGIIGSLPAEVQPTYTLLWRYSTEVRRDNPLVDVIGMQFGLSSEQVDELYRVGNAI
jgi:hypothetical protein